MSESAGAAADRPASTALYGIAARRLSALRTCRGRPGPYCPTRSRGVHAGLEEFRLRWAASWSRFVLRRLLGPAGARA